MMENIGFITSAVHISASRGRLIPLQWCDYSQIYEKWSVTVNWIRGAEVRSFGDIVKTVACYEKEFVPGIVCKPTGLNIFGENRVCFFSFIVLVSRN